MMGLPWVFELIFHYLLNTYSNLEILAKMEEEMEEKEKLEKGDVTPSEGARTERTATTEEVQAQEAQEVEEVEELTTENCEAKLKELKADLDQTAPLPRDTSFDR